MSDFRSSRIELYVRWRNREINRFRLIQIPKVPRDVTSYPPKIFKKWEKIAMTYVLNSQLKNPIFSSNNRSYITEKAMSNLSPGNRVTLEISDFKLWFLISLYCQVWVTAKWNRFNIRWPNQHIWDFQIDQSRLQTRVLKPKNDIRNMFNSFISRENLNSKKGSEIFNWNLNHIIWWPQQGLHGQVTRPFVHIASMINLQADLTESIKHL